MVDAQPSPDDTPSLTVLDHPIADDAIRQLRDHRTEPPTFREAMHRLTMLLAVEALRGAPRRMMSVQTPLEVTEASTLERRVLIAPILRAGLGMVDPILRLTPDAVVGCLGFYRDEQSLEAVPYYEKLPTAQDDWLTLVVDPMLATGGTAVAALDLLVSQGFTHLHLLSAIAAPEGVATVHASHPGVPIFTGSLDRQLNDQGYILPGLGDAGDRQLGTL
ncbi:uracil phosphoribosyltransferase [Mucisphaera sp.]|uniref:uracil phosphoribosyltransferase n=1 Tax=Mucisphaera sp. TaxID=2913024 RepID=UPI003D0BEFD8